MTHKLIFVCLLIIQPFFVKGESFDVRVTTLRQGTDGVLQIKLFGTLRDSAYINLGNKGSFNQAQDTKQVVIATAVTIGDVLKASLVLTDNTKSIEVDTVTVTEKVFKRSVIFTFAKYIVSGGSEEIADAPSPDISSPTISVKNASTSTVTKKEGSPFALTASVVKTSQAEVSYHWYHKPFFIDDPNLIGTGTNIFIASLKNENGGEYFCVMKLGDSVLKTQVITLKVNHLTLSPIEVTITGSSFIREGSTVSLICSSSSNLDDNVVSWYNGSTLLASTNIRVEHRMVSIQRNQSGTYTCQATAKGFGEVKRQNTDVHVIYLDDPKIRGHTVINNTLRLLANDSSELFCDSTSNIPNLQYIFTENGKTLATTSNKFIVKTGGGDYSCTVKNPFITKTLSFKIIAGSLIDPSGKDGGTPLPTTKDEDNFWTTEMIVIVVMAITFFFIVVILLCLLCVLMKRRNQKEFGKKTEDQPQIKLSPQKVYNGEVVADKPKTFVTDNLTSQRGPTLGDIQTLPAKDQLSISSEEYRSSTNDIQPHVLVKANEKPTETIVETKNEYATVDLKKKHRNHHSDDKSHRSKHRDRSRSKQSRTKVDKSKDEVDSSNWSYSKNSTVNMSYDDVEYC